MTPEERLKKSALKVEASRARAAKQELLHSLAQARLQKVREQDDQRRYALLGSVLVQRAAESADYARVLAQAVDVIKAGRQAALVDGWTVPHVAETTAASSAQATLQLSSASARSEARS
jgi:hypothetical protein